MYAVVNTGGKQYKVRQGEILRVEKIPGEVGSPVTFERILMFSDGENVNIGQPVLEDVAVEGHIVEQGKAKKIIVFKYKRRKRYRRKKGHRQEFTAVQIDSIKAKEPKAKNAAKSKDEPQPEAQKADAKPKTETAKAKKVTSDKADTKITAPKATPDIEETKKTTAKKADTKKTAAKETEAEKSKTKKAETKEAESKGEPQE